MCCGFCSHLSWFVSAAVDVWMLVCLAIPELSFHAIPSLSDESHLITTVCIYTEYFLGNTTIYVQLEAHVNMYTHTLCCVLSCWF